MIHIADTVHLSVRLIMQTLIAVKAWRNSPLITRLLVFGNGTARKRSLLLLGLFVRVAPRKRFGPTLLTELYDWTVR